MAKKLIDTLGLTKAKAIQILKQYDSTLIFKGFAAVGDATPAATLNHAYIVKETGTVFGVAASEGQVLVGNGTGFEANTLTEKVDIKTLNSRQRIKHLQNVFDDFNFNIRDVSLNITQYGGSASVFSYVTTKIFPGFSGKVIKMASATTATGYRGFSFVRKAQTPAAFLESRITMAFLFKPELAGQYRFLSNNGSASETIVFEAGETRFIQKTFDITTNTEFGVPIIRETADQIGAAAYVSPYILYYGEQVELFDYSTLFPDDIKNAYLASDYPKEFGLGTFENMYNDHQLMNPVDEDWVAENGSVVSYDDTPVFDSIPRTIKVVTTDVINASKFRPYFRYGDGYSVKAGQKLNCAFLMKTDVDITFRIDIFSTQNIIYLKAGVEKLLEFQSGTYVSDTLTSDYLTVAFVQLTSGICTFNVTPFIWYVGEKKTYSLSPVDKCVQWAKTKITAKKHVFLGDSMSVNRTWINTLKTRYDILWSALENTAGIGGYKPTAVGGTTVLPIQVNTNVGNNSIYERARDLQYYSPEIIFVFAGINDKGYLVNEDTGWSQSGTAIIPVGLASESPLKSLSPISEADHIAQNYPAGLSFAATYRGMIENIIDDNPAAKIVLMTMYPHQARNSVTGLPNSIEAEMILLIKKMNTAIEGIAKIYGCPVVDLYYNAGLNEYQFASETYLSVDGTHLLPAGEYRVVDAIAEKLGLP